MILETNEANLLPLDILMNIKINVQVYPGNDINLVLNVDSEKYGHNKQEWDIVAV